MSVQEIKLIAGKKYIRAKMWRETGHIFVQFGYNEKLLAEIKAFDGSKWHGYDKKNPRKVWSVKDTHRNRFQLQYLMGENPYAIYDSDLVNHTSTRSLYDHQIQMIRHGLTVHHGIWAAEMGTGKSLAAIELMEKSGNPNWYWIGPKSALYATRLELTKWESKVNPILMTYEKLRNVISGWQQGDKAPYGVIFDESARIKTPTALRSQAAMQLAEGVREDWGLDGYVILMSGAPAPKSPADWWYQCEVACPGFLREGNIHKFKNRLGLIVQREQQITGGMYPHLITWRDSELKCNDCGELAEHENHTGFDTHAFVPSINEVEALYRRMTGLVIVFFKKDCLDLPDKRYRIVECIPTPSTLRVAKLLVNTAPRVVTGMERMRELSDGFQYKEEVVGKETCPLCHGTKEIMTPIYEDSDLSNQEIESELDKQMKNEMTPAPTGEEMVICDKCGGEGEVNKLQRITQEVDCPKVNALINLLDEYSDVGRVVIYGGYTASIDRIVKTCISKKWAVLRADGRGWMAHDGDKDDMLVAMDNTYKEKQELEEKYPRLAFVGHPGAAGVGLNLTASPVIIYYSNDFNADSRIQSEDRIHRSGMDTNRGALIIDIVHLETDMMIRDNLKKKRKLQAMSLGDLKFALENKMERDADTISYDREV